MTVASFLFFLLGFVAIGAASALRSRGTTDDYFMASKDVKPWLSGLSAVATNNSGYMFIGMIGFTYTNGWSSVWLMLGWITGDLMSSLLVLRQLRTASDSGEVHSYPQLLAKWHGTHYLVLQRVAALLTILFLGAYAAAQLKAGSKALHVIFEWNIATGAIVGAAIVLIYSIAGGIRASIWTDAAQSFVMIAAMIVLMVVGINRIGGWGAFEPALAAVEPGFTDWFPEQGLKGNLLFVLGWLAAGAAVLGQPHVMIRYMTFDDASHVNRVRGWYYGWFTAFYGATIVVGLLARLVMPDVAGFDAELALPRLAQELLPDLMVGFVLAGLFAATMSTADSLVLACAAAAAQDFTDRGEAPLKWAKTATAATVTLALLFALGDNRTVFRMVLVAWGLLGSAFAPLILIYAAGRRPSQAVALLTMGAGVATFILWRRLGFSSAIYEVLPAMVVALGTYVAASAVVHARKTRPTA